MDKIKKAIAKLPKRYKEAFNFLTTRLLARNYSGLDIIQLKGQKDVFRLRYGKLRIIFKIDGDKLFILQVGLRSEKTYRNF